jgi:hydroxyacylglutathione hydrolase
VVARGDLVIDLRRADRFAAGFLPGTVSIPLNRGFVGYAGWVVPYDRDLYLLSDADDDSLARRAAAELAMIGLDRVAGWFGADAFETFALGGGTLSTLRRLDPAAVTREPHATIVDVRTESEWRERHIPGATLAPLGRLAATLAAMPRDTPLVLVCRTGSRSGIGASLLAREGFHDVANLVGGVVAWEAEGLPVQRDVHATATST